MTAEKCERLFKDYQRAHLDFVGYYKAIIAVHERFKPEFVAELERLHTVQMTAKHRWMEAVNETYLREGMKPLDSGQLLPSE